MNTRLCLALLALSWPLLLQAEDKTSDWQGYPRLDFVVDGRDCVLVLPKTPAPGNPWIWRTEFFGYEAQADEALLARGLHVAYIDVHDMYGAPVALDHMDQFYEHVVNERHLAAKAVLEGFSRGGLFAFNWAARHPERVASMYVDAPVCDFKSWPAGLGQGSGSPDDWVKCKQVYGLTDEQALAYPSNPVDHLQPLAAAKIPILSVCGDADTGVPLAENTAIVEARYKALGGEIQVILKPGVGHHPHSLKDPAPIVQFILKHLAPSPAVHHPDEAPAFTVAPGVQLKELTGRGAALDARTALGSVAFFHLDPGGASAWSHNKVGEESFFVLKGEGEVWTGQQAQAVRPGSFILIPPGLVRSIRASKGQALEFYAVTTPAWSSEDDVLVAAPEGAPK